MKKLYIIRHAKATKDGYSYSDHDRPLESRGRKDAEKTAAYCLENLDKPNLLISSGAVRTVETLQYFKNNYPEAGCIISNDLYLANSDTLRNAIEKADNKADVIYLVGHNPGMWELVNSLVTANSDFPTCALAVFQADVDSWGKFFTSKPELIEFLTPKIL